MQALDLARDNWPFIVGAAVLSFGVGAAVRWLRGDARRKLEDNDPKNDGVAHAENAIADELEAKSGGGIFNLIFGKKK